MYRFPENGIVNELWAERVKTEGRQTLSCVERLPSGVQVIALPHCTLRASVPGKVHKTYVKPQEKAPCLAANQVNIGVEIIVLNSVVLSYRDVLRN